jgi:hypothetical protein
MKVGDLVKISCTCGANHDKDPLIGVILTVDVDLIEVMIKGKKVWTSLDGVELVDESR